MKKFLYISFVFFALAACGGPGKSGDEEIQDDGTLVNLSRDVKLGKGNIFYKEISNVTLDTILLEVEVSEQFQRMFDMNVIEKTSFDRYDSTRNQEDLIFVHKLRDVSMLDTALDIPPGTYLLALQNYANADTIGLSVSFTFPD